MWDKLLDVQHAEVVTTYTERWPRENRAPETVVVIVVEPDEESRNRCPRCGQAGQPTEYDVTQWPTLDVHGKRAFLEARLPRIVCGEHGTITAMVSWAHTQPHSEERARSATARRRGSRPRSR